MSVTAVRIPNRIINRMVQHAALEAPRECCGIISGKDGKAKRIFRATNVAVGVTNFAIGPEEQCTIDCEIERAGQEVCAVYHSHPRSPAVPSAEDVRLAWLPCLHIIVSLAGLHPEVRAWLIADGNVEEVPL